MEIKLTKVHTTKDLLISAIVLAAGIGLYFVNAGLGILLVFCGILMLLFFKGGYKREGEDIVLQKKALDVAHTCRESSILSMKSLGSRSPRWNPLQQTRND